MDAFTIAAVVAIILLAIFEIASVIHHARTGEHPYDAGEGGNQ